MNYPIPIIAYLIFGAIMFAISLSGIMLNRKNFLILLMSIELMLLGINTNFIAFSEYTQNTTGEVFVFFVLTIAAAEAAIGLAIAVVFFRTRKHIDIDQLTKLKG